MKSLLFLALWGSLSVHADPLSENAIFANSIQAHQEVQSYSDWHDSPFHPDHLFTDVPPQDLCDAASQLSMENMNLFYNRLFELAQSRSIACLSPILNRHSQRLAVQSIQMNHQTPFSSFGRNHDLLNLKFNEWGPSEPIELDSSGGPLIVSGDLPRKHLMLSFDDGPHPALTEKLLKILGDHKVLVNFFVVGRQSKSHQRPLIATEDAGHIIGTHSSTHADLRKLSFNDGRTEIDNGFHRTMNVIKKVAPFFRFPYGAHTKRLRSYLRNSDIAEFYWNIDTLDWKIKDPKKLLKYTLDQIEKNGRGVVLFHDIQPQTIAMMPALLDELEIRGYRSVYFTPKEWLK